MPRTASTERRRPSQIPKARDANATGGSLTRRWRFSCEYAVYETSVSTRMTMRTMTTAATTQPMAIELPVPVVVTASLT